MVDDVGRFAGHSIIGFAGDGPSEFVGFFAHFFADFAGAGIEQALRVALGGRALSSVFDSAFELAKKGLCGDRFVAQVPSVLRWRKKQEGLPVWQEGPTGSTSTKSVSASQSA